MGECPDARRAPSVPGWTIGTSADCTTRIHVERAGRSECRLDRPAGGGIPQEQTGAALFGPVDRHGAVESARLVHRADRAGIHGHRAWIVCGHTAAIRRIARFYHGFAARRTARAVRTPDSELFPHLGIRKTAVDRSRRATNRPVDCGRWLRNHARVALRNELLRGRHELLY